MLLALWAEHLAKNGQVRNYEIFFTYFQILIGCLLKQKKKGVMN